MKTARHTPPPYTIENGYEIRFNVYWAKYQVSHDEIGACIASFNNINDAIEYCKKG